MAGVLAVVSKAVFEKQAPKGLALGAVWPVDRYVSKNPGLASLGEGGALFLVTVRPPDERLWLVAVLEAPTFDGAQWVARANAAAVADVTPLLGKLVLATGKGITAAKGKLGMSLQTPRALAESDVALLRGAVGGGPRPKAPPAKPAPAAKAPVKPAPPAKAQGPVGRALEAAAKALPSDPEAAIRALVEAWRARPAAELAALVALVGSAFPGPPFEGTTDAWVKAAKTATPMGRTRLLAALRGGRMGDLDARIAAASKWGPDPRTADALAAILRDVPYTSDGSFGLWDTVFSAVAAQGDPRFAALAVELPKAWKVRESLHQRLTRAFARVAKALPPAVVLGAEEQAQARALEATLRAMQPAAPKGARTEAALLADVYAHPGDDAPRLVYADFLEEKGDPRAELIQLQCREASPASDKRVRALLDAHGKTWLGPLAPVIGAKFEFRRGFLAKGVVKFKNPGEAERFGHEPAWATVEELEWSTAGMAPSGMEDALAFVGPAMKSLRVARGASAAMLLAAPTPWAIEALATEPDLEQFRALLTSPKLPSLRRLEVGWRAAPSWLDGVGEVRPRVLVVEDAEHRLSDWVASAEPTSLERLEVASDDHRWIFTRGDDGSFGRLRVEGPVTARVKELYAAYDRPLDEVSVTVRGPDDLLPPKPKVARPPRSAPKFTHVYAVAWTPEGLWVAESSRVTLVEPTSGRQLRTFPIDEAERVALSADGRRVFTVSYHRLEVYSTATGRVEWKHTGKTGSAQELGVTPDGRFALAANEGRAILCDLDGRAILREQRADTYYSASLAPSGRGWAQTLNDFAYVFTPDPKARAVRVGEGAHRLGWLSDDRLLVGHVGKLEVWDPWTAKLLQTLDGAAEQFVEHGGRLACIRDDHLCLLDTSTWATLWRRPELGFEAPTAFSPDGRRLVVVVDGQLRFVDAATGEDGAP